MPLKFTRRAIASATAFAMIAATPVASWAQSSPEKVKVGLLLTLSGIWARPGESERYGAELAVKHINENGGIKALDGAEIELVIFDAGDSVERAKNAAQRMVAEHPDMVAASGAVISSLTLAATEVTERAGLPMMTLSYSDQITDRGFNYIFQTSATGATQAQRALPELMNLAESAGDKPETIGIIMDNTAANYAFVDPMKAGIFEDLGLELVMEEVYTPPMSDATPIVQKVRATRPDLLLMLTIAVADAKQTLEKLTEFGLGGGAIPIVSNGNGIAEPNILDNMDPALLEGVMSVIANFGGKGQDALATQLKEEYDEPWVVQGPVSGYGTMMIIKEALEAAGKADREAVAEALRNMDLTDPAGPAGYFPGGRVKFDEKGRRVDAGLVIVQWQNGTPVTVYPPELAVSEAFWPE